MEVEYNYLFYARALLILTYKKIKYTTMSNLTWSFFVPGPNRTHFQNVQNFASEGVYSPGVDFPFSSPHPPFIKT